MTEVNFDAPSSFNSNAGFHRIKFGENAPLLETELNEMQDIIGDKFSILLEEIVGEGRFLNFDIEVNADTGLFQFSGTAFINSTLVKISTLSNSSTDSEVHIFLGYKEVDINANSTINSLGNLQGTSTEINNLIDVRVGEETSRRKQIVYNLFENQLDESYNYIELGIKRTGGRPVKTFFVVNENIKAKGILSEEIQQRLDGLRTEFETHKDKIASREQAGHIKIGDGFIVDNGLVNSLLKEIDGNESIGSSNGYPKGITFFECDPFNLNTEMWCTLLGVPYENGKCYVRGIERKVQGNDHGVVQEITVLDALGNTRVFQRMTDPLGVFGEFVELTKSYKGVDFITETTLPNDVPVGEYSFLTTARNWTSPTESITSGVGRCSVKKIRNINDNGYHVLQEYEMLSSGSITIGFVFRRSPLSYNPNAWGNWERVYIGSDSLPLASVTSRGVVILNDTRTSSSKTSPPTADALRLAYNDLQNNKVNKTQSQEIVAPTAVSWDEWWGGTRYHKDEMGNVRVWISRMRNTKPLLSLTLLNLPVGYRPLQDMYSYVWWERKGMHPLYIYTDGAVYIGNTSSNEIVDGDTFIAYFEFKV